MTLKIEAAQVYKTADGKTHSSHKEAVTHSKFLKRIDNIKALDFDGASTLVSANEGGFAVPLDDLPAFLALNADKILEALDVKQTRNRKDAA